MFFKKEENNEKDTCTWYGCCHDRNPARRMRLRRRQLVRSTCRSTGIGRALLTHLKARHPLITLQVYQNNQRALAFYQREGFSPLDQDTEPETGQVYLTLVWRKP